MWPSRSTRPSFAEAYLGATPMVCDCLLRSVPCVVRAVCRALIAPSILRCQGTPRPIALGPLCFRRVQLRRVGVDVQGSPMPGHTRAPCTLGKMSSSQLPSQHHMHSAPNKHPHYCTSAGIHATAGCSGLGVMYRFSNKKSWEIQVLQLQGTQRFRIAVRIRQEPLYLCYREQASALLRVSGPTLPQACICLGGKSTSRTPRKCRFCNKNSCPSAITSRHPH